MHFPPRLSGLCALLGVGLALVLSPSHSQALEPPRVEIRLDNLFLRASLLPAATHLARQIPAQVLTRFQDADGILGFDGLGEQLLRMPLYPVLLGDQPRTPSDPDQSVGVVWRIPFSL